MACSKDSLWVARKEKTYHQLDQRLFKPFNCLFLLDYADKLNLVEMILDSLGQLKDLS